MEISKFKSQLSTAFEQGTAHLRQAQGALTRLGRSAIDGFRRVVENELRKLVASCRDAIVATSHKVGKFRSQLSTAFEQGTARLRQARSTLLGLVTAVIEKPRRLRQELHARQNELRGLLASSLDAIIVTNHKRRFVAANPKALDFFGVSEKNLGKFTVDVFLAHSQIPYFDRGGSPFLRRQERHGICKIRRLDGSLRVAEYVFVANCVPFRHLCRFRDVTPQNRQFQPHGGH